MTIPDEAVEAAARAESERDRPGMWEHETESYKDALRRDARLHLAAAAPHLLASKLEDMAAAWGLGMWTMYNTTSGEWPPIPEQNPFRGDPK